MKPLEPPAYSDASVTVHHGDCLDVLRLLPDASIDAVVTDGPYGLADLTRAKIEKALAAWLSGDREHVPDGRGFMGREWDEFVPPPAVWDECMRVMKPGGFLLAFAATRTADLMGMSIRLAGFEMRDSIAWLYGNGFPKSHDVSKAIDKRRDDVDDVRRVCRWLRGQIDRHPLHTVKTLAGAFGFDPRMVEHWAARDTDSQPSVPTLTQWDRLRDLLGFDDQADGVDADVLRLNLRKGEPGEAWAERPVTGRVEEWENRTAYALTSRDGLRRDEPATDEARRWQGWGTALKPAHEPIVVARKPLAGTVAANVLAHGTGALNIEGCRVEMSGRWPANVVLTHSYDCDERCADDCPVAQLDRESGERPAGGGKSGLSAHAAAFSGNLYGAAAAEGVAWDGYGDEGGASRFFPVFRWEAKAPMDERPRDGEVAHPTVKPLDLMRWLVRLVTPPGGVVLDPFLGSGTTAEACVVEHFRCIGVEREEAYLPLIRARLTKPIAPVLF